MVELSNLLSRSVLPPECIVLACCYDIEEEDRVRRFYDTEKREMEKDSTLYIESLGKTLIPLSDCKQK